MLCLITITGHAIGPGVGRIVFIVYNLLFLESYGQGYPDSCESLLDCGSEALTCSFNRRGTLLAVGCNDGRIAVWDFLTRGIAKSFSGHTHPITSLRLGHAQSCVRDVVHCQLANTDGHNRCQ